ncbi:hypothetical protein BCIN_12g02410 [Botrytis cinerea B05.10]|uniref:Uncharacterized protein n=1 Tax=Botryotinia fuckeliana (strain B05.10) TaxID=332648 RepID=A0A384JYS8_BOTFB|nr:hypothetical protein BCIN_12g02410 [Botrytis cinerea B05.10]ATZ55671.1 hypothetical protein BCIN_12g02410 [Botrytis cinerea B05.10]
MAKGLAEYITSYFRKTPQVRQSSRQSIELNVVDANGVPLTPPRANQILHEIETGVYVSLYICVPSATIILELT